MRRFLLAAGGALLFGLACLTAALGPAATECSPKIASCDQPTLY